MRKVILYGAMTWLLSACSGTGLAPVTYADKVSVHSVLPVHVRVANGFAQDDATGLQGVRFGTDYQQHFADSLRTELVRHGVFGSVSEASGEGVFRVDVLFARMSSFPASSSYRMTVFLETAYNGESDVSRYHVLFMDEGAESGSTDGSADRNREAAAQLMSLIMADVQQAVIARKVSLKAHVKAQRTDIPRMLVKW